MRYDTDIVESCNSLLRKLNGDQRKAKNQIMRTLEHRQLPMSERERLNSMLNYILYGRKK